MKLNHNFLERKDGHYILHRRFLNLLLLGPYDNIQDYFHQKCGQDLKTTNHFWKGSQILQIKTQYTNK